MLFEMLALIATVCVSGIVGWFYITRRRE